MEGNNPIQDLITTTMEHISASADANTIIGTPIEADGVTLIPVSKMSIGVAGGGSEFSTKKQPGGTPSFGGGSGASAKLEPVAFLVIRGGDVKLLPVSPFPPTLIDRIVETVPELVDKITDFIDSQQEKKVQKAAAESHDFAE